MTSQCDSVSRMIAIKAMISLGLDPSDFKVRDKLIMGICETVNDVLDQAAATSTSIS